MTMGTYGNSQLANTMVQGSRHPNVHTHSKRAYLCMGSISTEYGWSMEKALAIAWCPGGCMLML